MKHTRVMENIYYIGQTPETKSTNRLEVTE